MKSATISLSLLFGIISKNTNASVTSLLKGYTTTFTNVDVMANVTLDARDMHRALTNGNFDLAKDIYLNGKHAGEKRALSTFSLDAWMELTNDPDFLFQVYGLSNGNVADVTANYAYGHKFVMEALNDPNSGVLAAEAALALNLWMWVQHKVWRGFRDCKQGSVRSDIHSYDEAIAYWIGAHQGYKLHSGWGLFEFATVAEFNFGLRDKESKELARANELITDIYSTAKMYMSYQSKNSTTGAACMSKGAMSGLFTISSRWISAMRIPLMQKLIHALEVNDKNRIKLYALSIVPQMAACKPSVHLYLQNKLIIAENYNPENDRTLVLQLLQSTYDCLGFTCADIGAYQTSKVATCADPPDKLPLVMYTPTTRVRDHAKIDLDVLQIKILMELRANDTAYDIYSIGKNSIMNQEHYMSIKHMGSSNNRNKVPRFYQYKSFYNDTNYADVMITMAFKEAGRYNKLYDSKMRAAGIVSMMVNLAIYMYAMECFWWALDACAAKKKQVAKYDEGVAFLIGSIEGPSIGFADVDDGMLLYNLINKNCVQFGVCDDTYGVGSMALTLMAELNAGKAAMSNMKCKEAETHIVNIADMILLPLFQDIVKYSLIAEDFPPNTYDPVLAQGESSALALLPVIDFFNESDAITVAYNMILERNVEPVKDGAHKVAKSLVNTFHKLNFNCSYMGNTENVDICEFQKGHDSVIQVGAQGKADASTASVTSSGNRYLVGVSGLVVVVVSVSVSILSFIMT